jgi:tetratricopeptide (TPR) repeat protein
MLTGLALAREGQPTGPTLEEQLQSARSQLIADPREALDLASRAVAGADASGDAAERAAARQVRGDALRFLGQHEHALADYGVAGDLFRRLGRPADAARTDASAVDSLRCLGRAGEALRRAMRARRVFRRLGEELRTAVLDEIVGLVYLQQSDYARALRYFDRARPVVAATGRPIDLAALNNNAATTLTNLDRLREAETLYAAARSVYAEHGTEAALARVDVNLGYLAFRQGRYGAALDLLRRAGDVFAALRNLPMAIGTRLDLVDTYLALNLLDEAGELGEEQLRLASQSDLEADHARALFYLSTQRARLGRFDEALSRLVEAESEFAAQGNHQWQARCAVARAALLLATPDTAAFKDAIALSRRAARTFARLGLPSRQAVAGAVLARALLRVGRSRAAEDQVRSALWLAQGVGVPWLLFECHYTLGLVLRSANQPERAYAAFREAADALERVRAELQPEELRISLISDKTNLYQELVLLCLERSAISEALQHAERAKSRVFAERLAASVDPLRHGIDAQVLGTTDARALERMRELRDELVWLYSRMSEGVGAAEIQRFRHQVAVREAELVRLQRRLQPASRAHVVAMGIGATTADAATTLDRLRRRLQPGTVVLEYFQAGDELVLFVFDQHQLSAHRLGPVDSVLSLVDRFQYQVSKFGLGDDYVRSHADTLLSNATDVLAELYARLVGPCADSLVDARQLIVVPHGALHGLPFHALTDPTGTPLVERLEITYAPSSTVLASCFDRPCRPEAPGTQMLVGVSDPALPQIDAEIASLREVFASPVVLSGEAATEQAFRHHAAEAELIHLASHAIFRQDNPLFSAIKLADGWLSVYDLYNLRLRASLVTLSACETGVSDVLAGDELIGLARGFFQAGAASVVVSLWPVNDASTARLMTRFYRHLRAGATPAAAMRRGQAELRREYPHPYYWAPFLVIGRP